MVAQPVRHLHGLVAAVPRAAGRLLPQQRGLAARSRRRLPRLEHALQEINTGVHLPLPVASAVVLLRALPPQLDPGRDLLGQNRSVGQP